MICCFNDVLGNKSVPVIGSHKNIAFDMADLTAKMLAVTTGKKIQIEAFKYVDNDRSLKEQKHVQLAWLSIGHPRIIAQRTSVCNANANGSVSSAFQFTNHGFHVAVEMLSDAQQAILADAASRKYAIPINASQINDLPLEDFVCSIQLLLSGSERISIKGRVHTYNEYPLRMDFIAPESSIQRTTFEKELSAGEEFTLKCAIASIGRVVKSNTLTISASQLQSLQIEDKLFGPVHREAESVFVTRHQLANLAVDLHSRLNVWEDYEMPQSTFSEIFVQDFVQQLAAVAFQQVDFATALKTLSTFTLNVGGEDLRADEIALEVGRALTIEKSHNKSHLVYRGEESREGSDRSSFSGAISSRGRFGIFGGSFGVKMSREREIRWREDNSSVDDQLRELNADKTSDFQWQREGNRIVPKSLNVAKVSRGSFSRSLVSQRVRRQTFEAPFQREFALYTREADFAGNEANDIDLKLLLHGGLLCSAWLLGRH
ncbi:unnamed protein product [Sphagnum balticum]